MKLGFSPIQGGQQYDELLAEVQEAERQGFDSVFLQEHHETKLDQYWSDPLSVLTGLATVTDSIDLGTGVLLLPLYHPVRLAERGAILDNLSEGRFILGTAIGYRQRELDIFHVPRKERARIFCEYLALVSRLWMNESVTFDGEYYQVEDLTCTPRPTQSPRPRIWIGGYHDVVLKRAARFYARGEVDAWFPGTQPSRKGLVDRRTDLEGYLADRDVAPESVSQPVLRDGIIAETTEEANEIAQEYLISGYEKQYKGQGHEPSERGDLAHDVLHGDYEPSDLSEGRFIIGDPDDWLEDIERYEAELGADHLAVRLYFEGMAHEDVMDQIELLGSEVIPHI